MLHQETQSPPHALQAPCQPPPSPASAIRSTHDPENLPAHPTGPAPDREVWRCEPSSTAHSSSHSVMLVGPKTLNPKLMKSDKTGRSGALCTGGAGLLERSTAVDSLEAVAAELRAAKPAMLAFVPQAEHHIVEAFFSRTVQASGGSLGWLKEAAHCLCSGAHALCCPLVSREVL